MRDDITTVRMYWYTEDRVTTIRDDIMPLSVVNSDMDDNNTSTTSFFLLAAAVAYPWIRQKYST